MAHTKEKFAKLNSNYGVNSVGIVGFNKVASAR
jgi:hypothetical protein